MKKYTLISVWAIIALQWSFAQDAPLQYRLCTGCSTVAGNDNLSADNYQYGAAQNFISRDITSDYGYRNLASSPWHKGVDFKPYVYAGQYNGGRGTSLLAAMEGVVENIQSTNFKHMTIRHNFVVPYVDRGNALCYAHIFHNGWSPVSMQSGKFVLAPMDAPNSMRYAIIDLDQGRAIGAPEYPNNATVTFDNIIYSVDKNVSTGQDIAPLGSSGGNYATHLHLDLLREVFVNMGLTIQQYQDRTNRYDPLSILDHDNPNYEVKWRSRYVQEFGSVEFRYPGTSPTQFLVRGIMDGATIPPNGITVPSTGFPLYDNVALNADDIEIQLSSPHYSGGAWSTVKGPSYDAKVSHGGRDGSDLYPMINGINVTSAQGNWDRQGIRPWAYSNSDGHPYDDYYFTDVYTRIHKDDNKVSIR